MSVDTRQNQSSFYFFLIFFKSLCHKNPDLLLYTGRSCYLSIIRLLVVRRTTAELSFLFPLILIRNALTCIQSEAKGYSEKYNKASSVPSPASASAASPAEVFLSHSPELLRSLNFASSFGSHSVTFHMLVTHLVTTL